MSKHDVKGDEDVYFIEFLALMLGAVVVVYLLLTAVEKTICHVNWIKDHPVIRLMISLVFVYVLLLAGMQYVFMSFQMPYFLIAGAIIILNQYWFGHFEGEKVQEDVMTTEPMGRKFFKGNY